MSTFLLQIAGIVAALVIIITSIANIRRYKRLQELYPQQDSGLKKAIWNQTIVLLVGLALFMGLMFFVVRDYLQSRAPGAMPHLGPPPFVPASPHSSHSSGCPECPPCPQLPEFRNTQRSVTFQEPPADFRYQASSRRSFQDPNFQFEPRSSFQVAGEVASEMYEPSFRTAPSMFSGGTSYRTAPTRFSERSYQTAPSRFSQSSFRTAPSSFREDIGRTASVQTAAF